MFSTIDGFKAEATNWIQTYEDDKFLCYFDSDSFNYNQDTNIVKCWVKMDYKNSKRSVVAYDLLNYNDQTYAVKSSLLYEDGQSVDSINNTIIEYEPIPPDIIIYETYSKLDFIKSLTDRGVEWEFNNEYLPTPSDLNSEFWVKAEDKPNLIYDKITYSLDKRTNTESYWAKEAIENAINYFSDCGISEYDEFYGLLKNWQEEITNSFTVFGTSRINNSYMESKNRQIERLIYNANGYQNFKRTRNRIMYCLKSNDTFRL